MKRRSFLRLPALVGVAAVAPAVLGDDVYAGRFDGHKQAELQFARDIRETIADMERCGIRPDTLLMPPGHMATLAREWRITRSDGTPIVVAPDPWCPKGQAWLIAGNRA